MMEVYLYRVCGELDIYIYIYRRKKYLHKKKKNQYRGIGYILMYLNYILSKNKIIFNNLKEISFEI